MTQPDDRSSNDADQREPRHERWTRLWPPTRVALQLILGQLVAWALRKWLG